MSLSPPTAALLGRFHARKPARIWSLIVTLYGDAIVPRGGSLWIGSLIEIMALFGIDAGHVRTAVSRLSSEGWLVSTKRGRASYYRLTRIGEAEFLQATQRIYAGVPAIQGDMQVAVLGPAAAEPTALRGQLKAAGYAAVSPAIHVGFRALPPDLSDRTGLFLMTPRPQDRRALAAAAFPIDAVSQGYREFVAQFSPLSEAFVANAPGEEEALVARTLLIHAFRRVVLRDPGLPREFLPADWQGLDARALAGRIYKAVAGPSERLLDRIARNEDGPLRPAAEALHDRLA